MYFCFDWCELCDQKVCTHQYFCFDWCELCDLFLVAQIVIKRFAHISISVLTGVNCVIHTVHSQKPPSWADKPSHHKLQCQSSSSFEDLLKVCLNVSSKSLVIKLNE